MQRNLLFYQNIPVSEEAARESEEFQKMVKQDIIETNAMIAQTEALEKQLADMKLRAQNLLMSAKERDKEKAAQLNQTASTAPAAASPAPPKKS